MSSDYGESWLAKDWNISDTFGTKTASLSGDGTLFYVLGSYNDEFSLFRLNTSDKESKFILCSNFSDSFAVIEVSYNGSFIAGLDTNYGGCSHIYISNSFGSQWSNPNFCFVINYNNNYFQLSMSTTGKCDINLTMSLCNPINYYFSRSKHDSSNLDTSNICIYINIDNFKSNLYIIFIWI